jgi:hypothetical protein
LRQSGIGFLNGDQFLRQTTTVAPFVQKFLRKLDPKDVSCACSVPKETEIRIAIRRLVQDFEREQFVGRMSLPERQFRETATDRKADCLPGLVAKKRLKVAFVKGQLPPQDSAELKTHP